MRNLTRNRRIQLVVLTAGFTCFSFVVVLLLKSQPNLLNPTHGPDPVFMLGVHIGSGVGVNQKIEWLNETGRAIQSLQVKSSCSCAAVKYEPDVVRNGDTLLIDVQSMPGNTFGLIKGKVFIMETRGDRQEVLESLIIHYWRLPDTGLILPKFVRIKKDAEVMQLEITGLKSRVEDLRFLIGGVSIAAKARTTNGAYRSNEDKITSEVFSFATPDLTLLERREITVNFGEGEVRIPLVSESPERPISISQRSPTLLLRSGDPKLVTTSLVIRGKLKFHIDGSEMPEGVKLDVRCLDGTKNPQGVYETQITIGARIDDFRGTARDSSNLTGGIIKIVDTAGRVLDKVQFTIVVLK